MKTTLLRAALALQLPGREMHRHRLCAPIVLDRHTEQRLYRFDRRFAALLFQYELGDKKAFPKRAFARDNFAVADNFPVRQEKIIVATREQVGTREHVVLPNRKDHPMQFLCVFCFDRQ